MKSSAFGSFIRMLRTGNHMTQLALAEKLHVTDKAVSKWERGLSVPDVCLFPRLAAVLGVTVADLLQECTDDRTSSHLVQFYQSTSDVRTPLHIILGCADLMQKHLGEPSFLHRYLESIRVSGQYLLSVLDQFRERGELRDLPEGGSPAVDKVSVPDFSGRRFLVTEDMALNREIAGEILRETGAEVDFAENGQVCLDKVASSPAGTYDLILMDIRMPGMDGLEATRRLRQSGCTIPIVAMTANVHEQDRKAALEAGMNAFTEKPVNISQLYAAIRSCLDQKS